jgi:hypothetical protein
MWAHPNLTRSISTERRDDSSTTVPKRRTQPPFPSSHSQKHTHTNSKGSQTTDLIWKEKTNNGFKFSYLLFFFILYYISFPLFSFSSEYFIASRETRNVFSCIEIFHHKSTISCSSSFYSLCVEWLAFWSMEKGKGMECQAINTLCCFCFCLHSLVVSMSSQCRLFLSRLCKTGSSNFIFLLPCCRLYCEFMVVFRSHLLVLCFIESIRARGIRQRRAGSFD